MTSPDPVTRLETWCDLQEHHLIDPDGISRKLKAHVGAYRGIIARYRELVRESRHPHIGDTCPPSTTRKIHEAILYAQNTCLHRSDELYNTIESLADAHNPK